MAAWVQRAARRGRRRRHPDLALDKSCAAAGRPERNQFSLRNVSSEPEGPFYDYGRPRHTRPPRGRVVLNGGASNGHRPTAGRIRVIILKNFEIDLGRPAPRPAHRAYTPSEISSPLFLADTDGIEPPPISRDVTSSAPHGSTARAHNDDRSRKARFV
ncbi:hypothetical protein EVAR_99605_1 [Eumeta japonica]|uniref:Uncharacterized protein n=1 Tax=Eumeta variegata TaxID=151549 RepID=A0A4C2A060_EUMVA|nr:hypothetical protein EVAR_99605_1 [Eumeta japonica]